MKPCHRPYEPLGELKAVAPEVWLVDGPEARMAYMGLRVPFPTRTTLVRLPDGGLWVHSPGHLTEDLRADVTALGPVTHIVAPNTLHHLWVRPWSLAFPEARVHAAPGLERVLAPQIGGRLEILGAEPPPAWGGVFDQVLVQGDILTEVDFLHRPSRTLVLTDLIENFEADRVCGAWRWLIRLSGCMDPHGSAPFDMRLSFRRQRPAVRLAAERMIGWAPERVILAHGRWYERDGQAELKRAFGWALR